MKKWMLGLAAAMTLLMIVITGCGAKMPTVAEGDQGNQNETKLEFNTEYSGHDYLFDSVD